MKEIWGRRVYDTLDEIVNPAHTALLVVDIQNDHGPQGCLDKNGQDISWVSNMLPNVKRVLAAARKRRMLTLFTSNTISRDFRAESPAQMRMLSKALHVHGTNGYEVEDTWGHEVLDELERTPDEPWIVKYRSSAFHGTRLDLMLANSGIETVVVMGLITEGCVESTVRDVLGYGYYPVVLRDCVTSSRRDLHDAALLVMSARYDVITAEEFIGLI